MEVKCMRRPPVGATMALSNPSHSAERTRICWVGVVEGIREKEVVVRRVTAHGELCEYERLGEVGAGTHTVPGRTIRVYCRDGKINDPRWAWLREVP